MTSRFAPSKSDPDEGYPGRLRCQGVVDVVSNIYGGLRVASLEYLQQALGVRFRARDIFHGYNALEEPADAASFQGVVEFLSRSSREDRQFRAFGQLLQVSDGQEPFFAGHVSRALLAPIEFDEFALHFFVFEFTAERLNPGRRKLPVVVETRSIFPIVQLCPSHSLAGEKPDRFKRGSVKGTAHVHQYAVDIEDD